MRVGRQGGVCTTQLVGAHACFAAAMLVAGAAGPALMHGLSPSMARSSCMHPTTQAAAHVSEPCPPVAYLPRRRTTHTTITTTSTTPASAASASSAKVQAGCCAFGCRAGCRCDAHRSPAAGAVAAGAASLTPVMLLPSPATHSLSTCALYTYVVAQGACQRRRAASCSRNLSKHRMWPSCRPCRRAGHAAAQRVAVHAAAGGAGGDGDSIMLQRAACSGRQRRPMRGALCVASAQRCRT